MPKKINTIRKPVFKLNVHHQDIKTYTSHEGQNIQHTIFLAHHMFAL
jgi:hypothetical protein